MTLAVATPRSGGALPMDGEAGKKLEAGRKVTILMSAGAPGQAAMR